MSLAAPPARRPSPIAWQIATVTAIRAETPRVKSLTLAAPSWPGHRAGQHVDLRLTAEDGYSVERSYSIGSEPERTDSFDITVEEISDGEVSPFLDEEVIVGDRIEVRGPIGGYFVWEASGAPAAEPLFLVAGGSGVVPLMAMLRHRARAGARNPTRLLYSSRHLEEVIYRSELDALAAADDGLEVVHTLTRSRPEGWTGYNRRIDDRMIADALAPLGAGARCFICGPTALVEVAANSLVRLGLPPDRVRTERFGPSGT
ncbi:MAG TPA: ferredoxin reductase [Candidatus Limnocylindrales bacterium]|nr:ferredoxin reductase [Candidatus Limnocylindrales bacterium]